MRKKERAAFADDAPRTPRPGRTTMGRPRISLDGGETWEDAESFGAAWSQKPGGEREPMEPMEASFAVPFTPTPSGVFPFWPGWAVWRRAWREFWPLSYALRYHFVELPPADPEDQT